MIADVVFNLPLERSFHYAIPSALEPAVQRGVRVVVPFGPRERVGMVTGQVGASRIRELKPLRRVLDPQPLMAQEGWALAEWLAAYYGCSLGEALFAMVPSALRLKPAPSVPMPALPAPDRAPETLTLTPAQQQALTRLSEALQAQRFDWFLLHGVTGSGKTEIYLRLIAQALRQGRGAICLIPEIALTPQTVERFQARFGEAVAVWHSRLTARQRAAAWQRLFSGEARIVVGPRSAVFAPVPRLGLLILDEEHDAAYKQTESPRYHARDVALERARLQHALVVLGSATPSVESYYAATRGRARVLRLPERVAGRPLPQVDVVDLRTQWSARRRFGPFSRPLEIALQQTVERAEQAMLLLNRRGFARTVQCPVCGVAVKCPHCAVPLIYHAAKAQLICHHCGYHAPLPEVCPACAKGYYRLRGAGTERVESELHRVFPQAAIARMDLDAMRGRGAHEQLYEAMKQRHIGLLVGTQMLAKGHDFPEVTLVGVVSADTSLNLPDFRAGERTFALLTQMAGRAGRGARGGRVILQTYCPEHYAIQAAKSHDYGQFYAAELAMRRRVQLPPFVHLVELTVLGPKAQRVEAAAAALKAALQQSKLKQRLVLLGPAPHRIPKLRGRYRMQLLLKGRHVLPMVSLVRGVLSQSRTFAGLPVLVDVDPQ